jgi:peptide/nickel transport system substrate-binding protein
MKKVTKSYLAFLLAVVMIASMLTGCSSGNDTSAPNPSTTPAPAEQAEDKILKIRKTTSMVSTDWEKTTATEDIQIIWIQVFEGLYGMNEGKGGYYNELAKDIKVSDDQLVYTIALEDATFQNGDKLKASDVVFSYDRAMKNSRFNYLTNMIESIKAVDDMTVEFKLKYPYAAIAHTFFSIKISSEREVTEAGEAFGTVPHTAGTGPYYISGYDPASGVKLTAYENYWRGAPKIKNVEYVVITEDSAAVIAYENGEIDYMHNAPTAEWEAIVAASGGNNDMIKGNSIRTFNINWQSPVNNGILGNEKVRQAIFYAINKENVMKAATNGFGAVAYEYIPSEYCATSPPASAGGFKIYDYDPAKVKSLLMEAGYSENEIKNGIYIGKLTTYGAQTGEKAKAATVIQANLAEVGLKCDVEVADVAIISPRLHAYDYDICIFGDSGNFDYNNIRQQVHSESVGMNVVNYAADNSPLDYKRVEELCTLGVSTNDVEKRLEYYTELWSRVMDSATIMPLLNMPIGIAWSGAVDPGVLSPSYYHIYDFTWK